MPAKHTDVPLLEDTKLGSLLLHEEWMTPIDLIALRYSFSVTSCL
jgi:hypothetical protein